MNIKHKNLLFVAAVINSLLGLFFVICAILEFTGVMQTKANNVTETIGVQLSYLVLVSDILILSAGLLSIFTRKTAALLNLQILLGVLALAWPLFLSITLFFSQLKINIRLVIMVLSSLFYIISVLVVKITNEEFIKTHTFNPSALITATGRRTQSVNVTNVFNHGPSMTKKKDVMQTVGNFAASMQSHANVHMNLGNLFSGKRKPGAGGLFIRRIFNGQRRRNVHTLGKIFNRRRRSPRRKFRLPR